MDKVTLKDKTLVLTKWMAVFNSVLVFTTVTWFSQCNMQFEQRVLLRRKKKKTSSLSSTCHPFSL
ncbi:hypothetical protein CROQUDRAFT_650053, partial [Cronartium quercuum f. sp. fusiforme G11]